MYVSAPLFAHNLDDSGVVLNDIGNVRSDMGGDNSPYSRMWVFVVTGQSNQMLLRGVRVVLRRLGFG